MKCSMDDFVMLRGRWENLRSEQARKEQSGAPRHNFIRLLTHRYKIDRAETGFHTPFLRDLLDPFGTHGQGILFLRKFLSIFAGENSSCRCCSNSPRTLTFDPLKIKRFPRPNDWFIGPYGEIDIQIAATSPSMLIFIENKIDAKEQDRQLERYRTILDKKNYIDRLLVFLARRGWGCPSEGYADFHITYEDHIAPWLRGIMATNNELPPKLRGNLEQYCEIIEQLSGQKDNAMENRKLVEALAHRDNFPCAIEICGLIHNVRAHLDGSFWQQISNKMAEACANAPDWKMTAAGSFEHPAQGSKSIYVERTSVKRAHLQLGVWQEKEQEPPFCAVCLSRTESGVLDLQELKSIQAKLMDIADADWQFDHFNSGWIGFFNAEWNRNARWGAPDDFRHRIAQNLDAEVGRLTEPVAILLRDHRDMLVKADEALNAHETQESK